MFFVLGNQGAKQGSWKKGSFLEQHQPFARFVALGDYTAGAIASIAFNEVVHSLPTL
jgi:adenine-specific DNA glycosylase